MKSPMFTVSLLAIAVALSACSKKQEVSFDTIEQARAQARANAEFNARKWRADTKVFADLNMNSNGDSTQVSDCPQGDGWASIDLIDNNGQKTVQLKCSTVSMNVGCLPAADFKTKAYAQDEGNCQPTNKVPFPLPKLVK